MNTSFKLNRWIVGAALAVLVAIVLVACGGGGTSQESATADERAVPLGSSGGPTIAWTPTSISYTANPGSRQSFPVSFTSSTDLSNVTISVVPELAGMVAVSPSSFSALQRGQVNSVILTVNPSSAEALRVLKGTIHVRVGQATKAKPLPVKVALVAPEVINGIAVPPEPPANLNNLTLAGFDANGNGVRDDIDRLIASRYGMDSARVTFTTSVARAMQAMFVSPTPETFAAYINTMRCVFDNTVLVDATVIERAMLSTGARKGIYGEVTAGSYIDREGC